MLLMPFSDSEHICGGHYDRLTMGEKRIGTQVGSLYFLFAFESDKFFFFLIMKYLCFVPHAFLKPFSFFFFPL